tara:strand:+ start:1702 stop:1926 length:225 start_codon:yes stop_codon:yes gene_type:complete
MRETLHLKNSLTGEALRLLLSPVSCLLSPEKTSSSHRQPFEQQGVELLADRLDLDVTEQIGGKRMNQQLPGLLT